MKASGVDFISVTKGAGGSLRGGTLPIAQVIKDRFGLCSLAHFTCRDYTVAEVENALIDHYYFGIRNILALRGDPPDGQPDHFQHSTERHTFAYQLVNQIRNLNQGRYIVREGFDREHQNTGSRPGFATNFCIGVAAYPEEKNGAEYFEKKVEAGADYAITQMIFDPDLYEQFLDRLSERSRSIPVLPGLRILTSHLTAERMTTKFGVRIPTHFIEQLRKATSKEDGKKIGLELTYQLCQELLKRGAPGIHLFIMNDEQTAARLLETLK